MNKPIVIKFGGTSVASKQRWQTIKDIVEEYNQQGHQVFIVHSAVSGFTDKLQLFLNTKDMALLESIFQSALALANELGISETQVKKCWQDLHGLLSCDFNDLHVQAAVLSWGEVVTHQLGLGFLEKHIEINSIDPKDILISSANDTRNNHSKVFSAKCDVIRNDDLIKKYDKAAYIMPGFIAATGNDKPVVLGRGGSDTSAAYLSVLLHAERLEIWTDVHGIFSANPHHIPTARLLEKIGYQEAREIAASGGKVLHPRCILPVEQNNIPLHIRNTSDQNAANTVLKREYSSQSPRVRAINTRHNITLVSMESIHMWHQAGFLGSVFDIYKEMGFSVDLISTAQTNVTVSLDSADNIIDKNELEALTDRLSQICQVEVFNNCSAVTLVGYRIRALADKIAPVISSFADQRIYLMTQSSNDLNQTIVVDQDQADKMVRALHDVLITQAYQPDDFGPTWQELMNKNVPLPTLTRPWWYEKKQQLIEIGKANSPCYVYHLPTIQQQINNLKSIQAVDKIHYACKANSHPSIIKLMHDNGLGLETVSPGEIERVRQVVNGIDMNDILFTPNFAPRTEYQLAKKLGVHTTIDNLFILEQWGSDLTGSEVILRLDPGHGSGHHRYVRTAGEQSKFGIHQLELQKAVELCEQHNITVKGLHAHSGSGILNYENWQRIIQYLTEQISIFPSAEIINIGGGMGIRENPADAGLNLHALDAMLLQFKEKHPNIQIWIEPGRYLVAHAGVLLAKVNQTKLKNKQGYVGVETGMNSLIRPALYGAWHNIVNLDKIDQPRTFNANIVGPMCESGDILGIDRLMPETHVGDLILIANTGAYGATMTMKYNLREPAQEIILDQ